MPLPGPVSNASGSARVENRVTLATPPMFSTAQGAAIPEAWARAW